VVSLDLNYLTGGSPAADMHLAERYVRPAIGARSVPGGIFDNAFVSSRAGKALIVCRLRGGSRGASPCPESVP
jgi:hypothetical protein